MRSRKFLIVIGIVSLYTASCIDRDTIAGTGKEEPDKMISAGGNFQSGVVNVKLPVPLKVRVMAANGRPVRAITVEFSVEKNNASFSDTTAVTNGDGYAQTFVTLGSKADSVRVNATVYGLKGSPVKFSLLASSSNAAKVELVSGNDQVGTVAGTLLQPLMVKVRDMFGNVVPNVPVYFLTSNGTIQPSTVLTDSEGISSSIWTLDTLVGIKTSQAFIPSISEGTVNFSAKANPLEIPSYFQFASNESLYTLQGVTINNILKVKVLDKYKNPLYFPYVEFPHGIAVLFEVRNGEGTVFPLSSITGSNGIASAGVSVSYNDSIMRITSDVGNGLPHLTFKIFAYKYLQIDSLKSSGGIVTIYWQKNLNPSFANYTLERCSNYNFDNSTVIVNVLTDENTTTTNDATAVVGTSPFYRVRVNYTNGFYFYTNLRDVLVKP